MKKYIFLSLAGLITSIFSQYGIINTAYNMMTQHDYRNYCLHELTGHGSNKFLQNRVNVYNNYETCIKNWLISIGNLKIAYNQNLLTDTTSRYLERDKNVMLSTSPFLRSQYFLDQPISKKAEGYIDFRR